MHHLLRAILDPLRTAVERSPDSEAFTRYSVKLRTCRTQLFWQQLCRCRACLCTTERQMQLLACLSARPYFVKDEDEDGDEEEDEEEEEEEEESEEEDLGPREMPNRTTRGRRLGQVRLRLSPHTGDPDPMRLCRGHSFLTLEDVAAGPAPAIPPNAHPSTNTNCPHM